MCRRSPSRGYPGFRTETWNGYVAPAGTPREIIERIAREIAAGCKDAAFVARLDKIGVDPVCSTPAEFAQRLRADLALWKDAVAGGRAKGAMTLRVAIPDLISPSYFPAIAAVEMGFLPEAKLELLYPVTKTYEELREGLARFRRWSFACRALCIQGLAGREAPVARSRSGCTGSWWCARI